MTGQTMFGKDGELVKDIDGMPPRVRKKYVESKREIIRRSGIETYCPFCLYHGVASDYTKINRKTGEIYKTNECPECTQRFNDKTIVIVSKGAQKYSEWFWEQVYSYKGHGRMSWEKIKDRLKIMGIADIFWDEWKKAKAERAKAP